MPLLLCDLDDTLVDRQETFRRWAAEVARHPCADEGFLDWLVAEDRRGYRPREELMAALKARLGLVRSVEDLVSEFRRVFPEMFHCEPPVLEALRLAREAGWRIAIVTNGLPTQLRKVQASGLEPYVDAVCVSEMEGCRKPDPRILHIAAEKCTMTLHDAWLVGDDAAADIGAAHAAQISSVWLRHGRQWPVAEYRPTRVADTTAAAIVGCFGGEG